MINISYEWNLGSAICAIDTRISNIPPGVSGTNMEPLIIQAVQTINNQTGLNIDYNHIDLKFHKAVTALVACDITTTKELRNSEDGSNSGKGYKLGDFTFNGDGFNDGSSSSIINSQYDKWLQIADKELSLLGRKMNFDRTY